MYSVSKKARAISSCKEIICSLNFLGEERCLCILILFLEGTVTNYTVFIIGGCKRKNTNIIFYKNSRLLMNATQPAFKDNDDLFIGTWWKQSFSLGLTRTSTAQMFPDDDYDDDDGDDDNNNEDDNM